MRDVSEIQDKESLKYVIRHELKDLGIKVPKSKEKKNSRQLSDKSKSTVFGRSLNDVRVVLVNEDYGQTVPKFVVDCVMFLENHLKTEGLFRKPGSQTRQRELKRHLEAGDPIPSDAHLADVASLFKQFFRQLSDPLLTHQLLDIYIKCQQIENELDRQYATLLVADTMPKINIDTLSYVMRFLSTVSSYASDNKMDSSNLAVVLAPSFMTKPLSDTSSSKSMVATDRLVKLQTGVVQLLIENADKIGTVPDSIVDKIYIVSNKGSDTRDRWTSEDELNKSDDLLEVKRQVRRKRRKSATIHGLVSGIGNRVRSRKPSNSNENVFKTPGRDEIISPVRDVAVAGVNETPKILRSSSKRKASDDPLACSAAKRKAMLQKMTVDPRYSKPGLSIHRVTPARRGTPRRGTPIRKGDDQCDSPMTPLRTPQPSLGEVDAITQRGEKLNFQTPSIKFADESFTSFSATPSHEMASTSLHLSYHTPGRKKNKSMLNQLSTKKKRRRSAGNLGNISTPQQASHTPKGMYQSIKRKLGHKSTHNQSACQHENSPAKVGYRLANEPFPDGLDTLKLSESAVATLKFDESALGIQLKRTPAFRSKHRKAPSAPATPVSSFCTYDIDIDYSPVSLLNQGINNVSLLNNSSPRVVVVDMKFGSMSKGRNVDVSTVSTTDMPLTGKSEAKAPLKPRRSGGNLTPVQSPVHTPQKRSDKKVPPFKPRRSQESLTPVTVNNSDKSCEQGSSMGTPVLSLTSLDSVVQPEMVPSISQESISSILSQVSSGSIRSTFSIEYNEEPTVVYDEMPATLTRRPRSLCADHSCKSIPAALGAMPELEKMTWSSSNKTTLPMRALSMESVDSGTGDEVDGRIQVQKKRLTKSISVDSGRAASIEDFTAVGVITSKKPQTSTSAESKETQNDSCFQFGTASSPLMKSLSTSDVNSCPNNPYATTPTRLTRSQVLPMHSQTDGNDTFNASVVQANIQLFNSMSHQNIMSASSSEDSLIQLPSGESPRLFRSMSDASDCTRRHYMSDDDIYKNRPDSSKPPPLPPRMVKSASANSGVCSQLAEISNRLDKITEKMPGKQSSTSHQISKSNCELHELNRSYEEAISKTNKMRRQSSLKVSMDDISTTRSLRKVLGDHNVTISPQELQKVVTKLPPLDCHPPYPMKLAKSTRTRTPSRRKHVAHRYSPSGKSSPGKPVKRLASPKAYTPNHHGHEREYRRHTPGRNQYPTSPKNPLTRASPRIYPRSPVNPLVYHTHVTPKKTSSRVSTHVTPKKTTSRVSSIPGHVEEDMEWRV